MEPTTTFSSKLKCLHERPIKFHNTRWQVIFLSLSISNSRWELTFSHFNCLCLAQVLLLFHHKNKPPRWFASMEGESERSHTLCWPPLMVSANRILYLEGQSLLAVIHQSCVPCEVLVRARNGHLAIFRSTNKQNKTDKIHQMNRKCFALFCSFI